MQMHMADDRARRDAIPGAGIVRQLVDQAVDVEWVARHLDLAVWARPFLAWAVAIDFDAVAIGIIQIKRLAD
jgi:hypothetical protein